MKVIGIDIGATYTKFGLVDESGNIFHSGFIPTIPEEHVTRFLPRIFESLRKIIEQSQDDPPIGIGIGAPNGNFLTGTISKPANLSWGDETPIVDIFKDEFGLPAAVTNDANAAAIGEMKFGCAKEMKNFLMLTLGTGLGSCLVVNGDVVYGHTGFAGELGHLIVREDGRESPYERRGALEAYVSVTGIRRTVAKMLADSLQPSQMRDIPYNKLTGEMINEAALAGDSIALDAFEYTGEILGKALADSVLYTSPEAIVLFGGLANADHLILQPTLRHMEQNLLPAFKGTVRLMISDLMGKNAGVLGAAALILDNLNR